ncbi:MAG TPA: hypothetical protein VFK10_20885 [Burkholderiaceae bacterium]|nr:hypothetical protein [Burkholderiaceae bacterium]
MRSIEFYTYLLPSARGDGALAPSPRKLTWWQAIAYPGATPIESSREVRQCPESDAERKLLGFHTQSEHAVARAPVPRAPLARRRRRAKR